MIGFAYKLIDLTRYTVNMSCEITSPSYGNSYDACFMHSPPFISQQSLTIQRYRQSHRVNLDTV